MPLATRNYASGLFLAAGTQKREILAAMEELCLAMEGSGELRQFLLSPAVPATAKKNALRQMLPSGAPLALNLLCLLVDKHRLGLLPQILVEFRDMVAKEEDLLVVTVTSAAPLSPEQQERIAAHYQKKNGAARVSVENRVVKSLVGGVQIRIGDMLTDDSLSGRLQRLEAAIRH